MADNIPGTAAITDKRTPPRGVLPRGTQSWIMVGLAVVILGIIVFTGRPEPTVEASRPVNAADAAPTPERVRNYQDRLRVFDERSRQPAVDEPRAFAPAPRSDDGGLAASPDPLEAEKKRRDYESLFASNVVISRRGDRQGLGTPPSGLARDGGSLDGLERGGAPNGPPSLDAVAEAVIRAAARNGQVAVQGLGATATPTPAAGGASPPVGRTALATTGPIEAAGPLHRLVEGTVIDAVLTNRLDGSTAAPVNCLVTNPIYSHSGQHVLIPAGSRIVGETKPIQTVGETRLAVIFHRIVLPDGSSHSLEKVAGLNQVGDAGLHDQVNHHYWSTVGASGAVGLISGFAQFLGSLGLSRGDGDRTVVIAGGVGDQTGQATAQTMGRFLNRLPTVTVREGHRVKVYLTSDLELPAYVPNEVPRPRLANSRLAGGLP